MQTFFGNYWGCADQSIFTESCRWGNLQYGENKGNFCQNEMYNGINQFSLDIHIEGNHSQEFSQGACNSEMLPQDYFNYQNHMRKQNVYERDPFFCSLPPEERYRIKLSRARDEDELSDYTRVIHNLAPFMYGYNEEEIRKTGFYGIQNFPFHLLGTQNAQIDQQEIITNDFSDYDTTMQDDCDNMSCTSEFSESGNAIMKQNSHSNSSCSFGIFKQTQVKSEDTNMTIQKLRFDEATDTNFTMSPPRLGRIQDKKHVRCYFK
ncbi:unnamed protein product [Moneuplotes crassus]|uniref:Uncharacterized protein n=1 Tax=Euplotes crassus TaxID=5936 RepID=A0AAD1XNF3_EUPCR|nr:unnamed protein product [Moneuplotes crassus]